MESNSDSEDNKDCLFILQNLKKCGNNHFCKLKRINDYEFCCKFKDIYFNKTSETNSETTKAKLQTQYEIIETFTYT